MMNILNNLTTSLTLLRYEQQCIFFPQDPLQWSFMFGNTYSILVMEII